MLLKIVARNLFTKILYTFLSIILLHPFEAKAQYDEDESYEYEDGAEFENTDYSGSIFNKYSLSNDDYHYTQQGVADYQLYNGGYKRRIRANDEGLKAAKWDFSGLGWESGPVKDNLDKNNIEPNTVRAFGGRDNIEYASDPNNRQKETDFSVMVNGGIDSPPGEGQGQAGKDEADPKTPPPPPDEPDVPVDTAIPFLLIAGIALAYISFKKPLANTTDVG